MQISLDTDSLENITYRVNTLSGSLDELYSALHSVYSAITDEQVHQMLAQRFLRESVLIDEETGECMDIVLSTGGSDMTAGRMADYCEECRAWARETLDLDIPDPEQVAGRRIAMR